MTLLGFAAFAPWAAGCGSSSDSDPSPQNPNPPPPDGGGGEPTCDPTKSTACNVFTSPRGLDSNLGTRESPLKTLKQALSIAKSGQTITLGDGQYDASNGEIWPQRVAEGVILEAATPGNAVLSGASTALGLAFAGSGEIRGLAFGSFGMAVGAMSGSLRATNVKVTGGGGFFLAEDVNATLEAITMESLSGTGVLVADRARLVMKGGTIRGAVEPPLSADACTSLLGVAVTANSTATVSEVAFSNLGSSSFVAIENAVATLSKSTLTRPLLQDACKSSQIGVGGKASVTVEDTTVSDYSGVGVLVSEKSGTVKLRRSTIKDSFAGIVSYGHLEVEDSDVNCRDVGIWLDANSDGKITGTKIVAKYGIDTQLDSTLTLRKSSVSSEEEYAMAVRNARADLGTQNDPGLNHIIGKKTGIIVYSTDDRLTSVQAVGNTWRPDLQGADAQGAYASELVNTPQAPNPGNFMLSEGSSIQF